MSSVEQLARRASKNATTYWRSLRELADDPEFRAMAEREFPAHADEPPSGTSRRDFLKVVGASVALAGLSGCRWPREEILPFTHQPAGRVPGVPVQYATSMELAGAAMGLLVTSYDGRPIKVEGNPEHPGSRGATDSLAQAAVLELYDPDRSRRIVERQGRDEFTRSRYELAAFMNAHFATLRNAGGGGLRVLAPASSSPTLARLRERFAAAFPGARWHEWEPLSRDNERDGSVLAFGKPYRTHASLDRALVIVSLDGDFLRDHPAAVAWARDYAAGRRADDGTMNRLWAVEPTFSLTGARADHRLAARAGEVPAITAALAAEVIAGLGARAGDAGREVISSLAAHASGATKHARFVKAMAHDLLANQGRGMVMAGPRQPAEVHALCHVLNGLLSNAGSTVHYTAEPGAERPTHLAAIRALASELNAGQVKTLVVLGGNPAYNAPADLAFGAAMARVETVIHLGLYRDETGRTAHWHVPEAHFLESWGDALSWDGTAGVVQPLIEPLFEGLSAIEVVAQMTGEPDFSGHALVRGTWAGHSADLGWRRALHDGVVSGTATPSETPAPGGTRLAAALAALRPAPDATPSSLEVVFARDAKVFDGRFANNAWLQELPDPLTKLTWDNAMLIAPATAAALGVRTEDRVHLSLDGREMDVPVYVMPGHAPNAITLPLGYGRTAAGSVGNGVGANAYAIRTTGAFHVAHGATIRPTGARWRLATTHDHNTIDAVGETARQQRVGWLAREGDLHEYLNEPDFAKHRVHVPELVQMFPAHPYEGQKWGMAIDLTSCIGCGACMVACVAENNIPAVGKKQVLRGREMHWIRVDRYFSGPPEAPAVVHQPVTCHHCENAPCEQVCPVAATVHDAEGLNTMVYNRCIGTRYCNNNCPYKVRRFNWLSFQGGLTSLEKMVMNPEVTVRGRGVMEKCSFCVQRINQVKIRAKNEQRALKDGDITPACAQACPTQAIVFGNLNDSRSRVAQMHAHRRSYAMLAELNTRPRLHYLARLRNPVHDMEAGTVVEEA